MRWGATRQIRVVITVEALAVLAYFAVPHVRERLLHQRAQRVGQDVRLITSAATTARDRLGAWPEDGAPGHIPASLASILPRGFTFDRGDYSLDWDHWSQSDGAEPFSKRSEFIGVSVIIRDPSLARAVADLPQSEPTHFTVGNRSTFPISDQPLSIP